MHARGPVTWNVSAMMRHAWAVCFFAGIAGFFIAVEIGGLDKPDGMDDDDKSRPVAELLGEPVAIVGILVSIAIAYGIIWYTGAKLQGGADWIGRLRPNPTQIHVGEAIRVTRTRGTQGRGSNTAVEEMAYTLEAADGRKISVSEAAVHRHPSAMMSIYAQALTHAIDNANKGLASEHPYRVDGTCLVHRDRFEDPYSKSIVFFAHVDKVQVQVGTQVNVGAYDAAGKRLRQLPDDAMMLLLLPMHGVKCETVRVAH